MAFSLLGGTNVRRSGMLRVERVGRWNAAFYRGRCVLDAAASRPLAGFVTRCAQTRQSIGRVQVIGRGTT